MRSAPTGAAARRALSLLLSLALIWSGVPAAALAEAVAEGKAARGEPAGDGGNRT